MKVTYEAAAGEPDIYMNEHDVVHGVPRIGDAVQHAATQCRVIDVIWRPSESTVFVILARIT